MLFVAPSLCLLLLLSLTTVCVVNSENEAVAKISEAENALNLAYEAVLQAEKAGANVTDLLSNLTEAGELLSKAKLVLSTNESAAVDFAVESQAKLNGFLAEADALRVAAAQQRYWDFIINVVGSIVGSVAVICGGFVVWTVLKRKYEKTESGV
jgi:VanZ family protein